MSPASGSRHLKRVAATIEQASRFVPVERLFPCTNCGMVAMDRSLAIRKLVALSAGAALARRRFDHSAVEEGCG
jgi:5-methyltetrahydropteroyltriglutamate--homocysteine methyltransferase